MTDIPMLVDTERTHLLTTLDQLDPPQWNTASLCAGWHIRDVVIHLLMPYELSVPRFLLKLAAARFDFDALAARWAIDDNRSPAEAIDALRHTAQQRFRVPGAPPEAPLCHLVIHAQDIYRPLGLQRHPDPQSARTTLEQMTSPRTRALLPPGLLDGRRFTASDIDWSFGDGAEVQATAAALITTLAGRSAALDELTGEAADAVRDQLLAASRPAGPPPAAPAAGLDGSSGTAIG